MNGTILTLITEFHFIDYRGYTEYTRPPTRLPSRIDHKISAPFESEKTFSSEFKRLSALPEILKGVFSTTSSRLMRTKILGSSSQVRPMSYRSEESQIENSLDVETGLIGKFRVPNS